MVLNICLPLLKENIRNCYEIVNFIAVLKSNKLIRMNIKIEYPNTKKQELSNWMSEQKMPKKLPKKGGGRQNQERQRTQEGS